MKQLTDKDIAQMIGAEFISDDIATRRIVRSELQLSKRIPHKNHTPQKHATLDLHQLTEEESWNAIMQLAISGVRTANIITGASGILKIKFQQWTRDSLLSPHITEFHPINNGSFFVKFKKHSNNQ